MTTAADAPGIDLRVRDSTQDVELGDGRTVIVRVGRVVFDWLGASREIDVLGSNELVRGGEGRPVVLVGTRLLTPHLLAVDYGAKTVDIESQY